MGRYFVILNSLIRVCYMIWSLSPFSVYAEICSQEVSEAPQLQVLLADNGIESITYSGISVHIENIDSFPQECISSVTFYKIGTAEKETPEQHKGAINGHHEFKNLSPGSAYYFRVSLEINGRNYSSTNFTASTPAPSVRPTTITRSKSTFSWETNTDYSYIYQIKWKKLECPNAFWNMEDKTATKKDSVNILPYSYPYSLVKCSIWSVNKEGILSKEAAGDFENTIVGVPVNEIQNVTCKGNAGEMTYTCSIRVESNCLKQNGPYIQLYYEYKPENSSLQKGNTDSAWIPVDTDEMYQKFRTSQIFLNFTKFKINVKLADKNKNFNLETAKEFHFVTSPVAPLKVSKFYNVSSSRKTINVKWERPPSWPRTGELEACSLRWKEKGDWYFNEPVTINIPRTEYQIRDLNVNKTYVIKIECKNKDVDAKGPSSEIEVKTGFQPTPPYNVTKDKQTETSLAYHLTPGEREEPVFHEMNISGEDVIPCSEEEITSCEKRDLSSGKMFTVKFRSCFKERSEICSGWVLEKKVWTVPVLPHLSRVDLNKGKTSVDEIVVTINRPQVEINGEKMIFIIVSANNTEIPYKEIIETCFRRRQFQPCYNQSSYWIYGNITSNSFSFKNLEKNKGYNFKLVLVLKAGDHLKIDGSEYTEKYFPKTYVSTESIGIGLGIVGILFLLVFGLFCFVKSRKHVTDDKLLGTEKIQNPSQKDIGENDEFIQQHSFRKGLLPPPLLLPKILEEDSPEEKEQLTLSQTRADVTEFETHIIKAIHSNTLINEFQSIPYVMTNLNCSHGVIPENIKKNRYKNNLPYDETRVILPPFVENQSDYINASYIDTPFQEQAFIACQGPKCDAYVDTRADFFRMIIITDASHILMMANLVEGGRTKVSQYWPGEGETTVYGQIKVTLKSTQTLMDFIIRELLINFQGQIKQVYQYQYTAWPDHGIPTSTYSLCQMIKIISNSKSDDKPIVVHCSAGIGRTGTILLVFEALSQLDHGYIDVLEALRYLRRGRPKLVENVVQYRFGHKLIWESISLEYRNKSLRDFIEYLKNFPYNQISQDYQILKSLPVHLTYTDASKTSNSGLNRNRSILPVDGRMVYLASLGGTDVDQYINAVRIDNYDKENAFIVMEHPMAHTQHRAWHLVLKYKIDIFILLNEFSKDDQDYLPIIPEETEISIKELIIQKVSVEDFEWFEEVTISISKNNEKLHTCQIFAVKGWINGDELPTDYSGLLSVTNRIKYSVSSSPQVISCGNGVTACGVFVSLCYILNRLEMTQEVNIFNSIASIIHSRPEFLISENQYYFLHTLIGAYAEKFSEYSNFA